MPSYPDQVRAAERTAARKRRGWKRPVGIAALRVAELDREFSDRYGAMVLPDDDAGLEDVVIMLHHLVRRAGAPLPRITAWLDCRAPWLAGEKRKAIVDRVIANPLRFRADTLAVRIGLTAERRARLKIRTIGAIDQTAEQRRARRRELQRQAKEEKRRAAGIPHILKTRAKQKRAEPWKAAGLSRATWYRHKAREAAHAA